MISNKTKINGEKSGYINIRQVQPNVYRVVAYFDGIKKEFDMNVPCRPELKTPQLLELAFKYLYDIKDINKVNDFINKHSFLKPYLIYLYKLLLEHFKDGKYELEVVTDHEEPEWVELFIRVRIKDTIENTINRYRLFIDTYFVDLPDDVRRLLAFSIGVL